MTTTIDQMTPEETQWVTEYEEKVAGIPDFFDQIEDPHWNGFYQPEGEPLTLAEASALYAGWTADIHKWFTEAIALRQQYRPGEASDEFDSYAHLERQRSQDALFYLGQRALHELGAKGWMYR